VTEVSAESAPGAPAGGPEGAASIQRISRRIVLAILLGVVIYGAIVLHRGASLIADRIATYAWWTFAAACGLAFTNYVLRFLKWEYYLSVLNIRGIPKGESFLTFLSGFVLTVTPGKVGEVFKSLILFQTRGIPIERTAPIVVAERVTDLIGVIAIIAVGSLKLPGGLIWASIGAGVVALLLACVASRRLSELVLRPLPGLPGALGRAGQKLVPKLLRALDSLRDLTTPRRLLWPTALSVVAWSLEGLGLYTILHGFGEKPPLPLTAFFYATATLAGALIPVPGGLGVTDELLEQQLARLGGVEAATATASMLLVRFATLWFAVAVGFAALGILRARHPALASSKPRGAAEGGLGPIDPGR